ncbi:MAG: zinc-ribbon domain-containing protein [bacterium]|nr:MAG: zinc-ribbon domain-containing protein [bacterium]
MFFIGIFGGGEKAKEIGRTEPKNCPRCHNTHPWTVYEVSKYFSFFFIPVARWGYRYIASCPICRESYGLHSKEEAFHYSRD